MTIPKDYIPDMNFEQIQEFKNDFIARLEQDKVPFVRNQQRRESGLVLMTQILGRYSPIETSIELVDKDSNNPIFYLSRLAGYNPETNGPNINYRFNRINMVNTDAYSFRLSWQVGDPSEVSSEELAPIQGLLLDLNPSRQQGESLFKLGVHNIAGIPLWSLPDLVLRSGLSLDNINRSPAEIEAAIRRDEIQKSLSADYHPYSLDLLEELLYVGRSAYASRDSDL